MTDSSTPDKAAAVYGPCRPGGHADPVASREPLTAQEVERIRRDFPILARTVRAGRRLVYLDTAATAQRPECVSAAMASFARTSNAAVHRGAHQLAEEATDAFEDARARVARFFGVGRGEIVFTSGTTAALNLVAFALAEIAAGSASGSATSGSTVPVIRPGDRILVTEAEHHANLVQWQRLAGRTGA
ncbi:MAG: aminotransferase class V-fold PLP-dependent enzyme, partial [Bifidobacteriaceae bacterium]|nr:aminotransferase class V-fold PLP-dependent enzyme [Bifidobacteriaceae bacterium]